MRITRALLAFAGVVVAAACKPKTPPPSADSAAVAPAPAATPLAVTNVDLGKSVDAEKKVTNSTNDFGPRDTIYASVQTTGTASAATLTARWSFENGQVVDSTSMTISPSAPAWTEFHITKASPWPTGKYKVAILLNGQQVQEKDFEIKK